MLAEQFAQALRHFPVGQQGAGQLTVAAAEHRLLDAVYGRALRHRQCLDAPQYAGFPQFGEHVADVVEQAGEIGLAGVDPQPARQFRRDQRGGQRVQPQLHAPCRRQADLQRLPDQRSRAQLDCTAQADPPNRQRHRAEAHARETEGRRIGRSDQFCRELGFDVDDAQQARLGIGIVEIEIEQFDGVGRERGQRVDPDQYQIRRHVDSSSSSRRNPGQRPPAADLKCRPPRRRPYNVKFPDGAEP